MAYRMTWIKTGVFLKERIYKPLEDDKKEFTPLAKAGDKVKAAVGSEM